MATKPITLDDEEELEALDKIETLVTHQLNWDFIAVNGDNGIHCIVGGTEEWIEKITSYIDKINNDPNNLH